MDQNNSDATGRIGQLACLPLLDRGQGYGDHAAIDGIKNQHDPGEFFEFDASSL